MKNSKLLLKSATSLTLAACIFMSTLPTVLADETEPSDEEPVIEEVISNEDTDLTDESSEGTSEDTEPTEAISEDIEEIIVEETEPSVIDTEPSEDIEETEELIEVEEELVEFEFEPLNDDAILTGWQQIDGSWYYYNDEGVKVTGWQVIEGDTYYFNYNGKMMTGWVYIGPEANRLFYFGYDGKMRTGWQDVNGYRFYFYEDGHAALGFQEIDGDHYFFNKNYGMLTGWVYLDGGYGYAASDGKFQTGWIKPDTYWYYINPETYFSVTGWQEIEGVTYYFYSYDGRMITGWCNIDGVDYYFRKSGALVTGDLTEVFDSAAIEADALNDGAHRCYANLDYDYDNKYSIVMFEGLYDNSCYAMVAEINRYRLEACQNGYPDPRNPSRALTMDDYVPIRWSRDLEEQAMANAAVGGSIMYHATNWYGRRYGTMQSSNEDLAWCGKGRAATLWYSERDTWVNQESGVTGHYTSMINPSNTHVGIAGFYSGGYYTYCGEFGATSYYQTESVDESKIDVSNYTGQLEIVSASNISSISISSGNMPLYLGNTIQLKAYGSVSISGVNGSTTTVEDLRILPSSWGSDNPDIISVDRTGNATALRTGTAKVYCKIGGKTYRLSITVSAAPTGWQQINGLWYYFNSNGIAATGWKKIGSKWYYFNDDHIMLTGWQKVGDDWYYFEDSGVMATGWKQLNNAWYYFGSSGALTTNWRKIGSKWYYFGGSGVMRTGWQKVSGKWYYFLSSGAMKTGWLQLSGKWYYFESSGAMVTGSRTIGGKTYRFDSNGVFTNP